MARIYSIWYSNSQDTRGKILGDVCEHAVYDPYEYIRRVRNKRGI